MAKQRGGNTNIGNNIVIWTFIIIAIIISVFRVFSKLFISDESYIKGTLVRRSGYDNLFLIIEYANINANKIIFEYNFLHKEPHRTPHIERDFYSITKNSKIIRNVDDAGGFYMVNAVCQYRNFDTTPCGEELGQYKIILLNDKTKETKELFIKDILNKKYVFNN